MKPAEMLDVGRPLLADEGFQREWLGEDWWRQKPPILDHLEILIRLTNKITKSRPTIKEIPIIYAIIEFSGVL